MHKDPEHVIDTLHDVLDWYDTYGAKASIGELLDTQDKMSIYNVYLSEYAADIKKNYNVAYYIRKVTISQKEQEIYNTKMGNNAKPISFNAAQSFAVAEIKNEFEEEKSMEALAYKLDRFVTQVNKVLSSIQQRISHAKKEWERSEFQS